MVRMQEAAFTIFCFFKKNSIHTSRLHKQKQKTLEKLDMNIIFSGFALSDKEVAFTKLMTI